VDLFFLFDFFFFLVYFLILFFFFFIFFFPFFSFCTISASGSSHRSVGFDGPRGQARTDQPPPSVASDGDT